MSQSPQTGARELFSETGRRASILGYFHLWEEIEQTEVVDQDISECDWVRTWYLKRWNGKCGRTCTCLIRNVKLFQFFWEMIGVIPA
jgi:hypothetical protein